VSEEQAPAAQRWHPRGFNNGLIVDLTFRGVSTLPTWLTYGIGHVGTGLAWRFQRSGTRALVENFRGIFPDRPDRELRRLALATYRSYARDVIDFIRTLQMTPDETRRLVSRLDTSAFDQAIAEGRGAIALSGHFGNWELGGVFLRRFTSFGLSVVAKAEPSQRVTNKRMDVRSHLDIETLEVRQYFEMALRIRERLAENRVVALLVDRHMDKDHVEVTFFGRTAYFLRTPALLALLTGAPIVPCFVYRDLDGHFAVECGPLIRVLAGGDRNAAVQRATQTFATLLERHIRQWPQYWYQFYPFWPSQTVTPETGARSSDALSR